MSVKRKKIFKKCLWKPKNKIQFFFLIEGDSFLRDRTFAKNTWEISMVNQLLQENGKI